jgi:hypothetical protein
VVDNLVRRGRTRGLGTTLITQRAAVINKNVLSQVGGMFFLQMGAPQDLDAVERWMIEQVKPQARIECRRNLPILGRGQAYYLHGGDRSTFSRFTVRTKKTFDSSVTPRMGETPKTMSLGELDEDVALAIDKWLVPKIVSGALEDLSEDDIESFVLGREEDDENEG